MSVPDEALDLAIADILKEARELGVTPSVEELRAAAKRERDALLAQSAFAEDIRRAEARVPVRGRERPLWGVARVVILLLCIPHILGTWILFGRGAAPRDSLSGDDLLAGAPIVVAVLIICALFFVVIRWLSSRFNLSNGLNSPSQQALLWSVGLLGVVTSAAGLLWVFSAVWGF